MTESVTPGERAPRRPTIQPVQLLPAFQPPGGADRDATRWHWRAVTAALASVS